MRRIRLAKSGYIFSSAAFCIAGLLLLLHPEISAEVLCKGLGILFLVWGVFKICGYLSGDLYRLAFQFDLACGILAVVLGFLMLVRSGGVLRFLNLVIGILVLTDGLLKIQTALDARRFGLERWWMIAGTAALASIFGFLIVADPFWSYGITGAVLLLGAALLVEGGLNLYVALYTIRTEKQERRPR